MFSQRIKLELFALQADMNIQIFWKTLHFQKYFFVSLPKNIVI